VLPFCASEDANAIHPGTHGRVHDHASQLANERCNSWVVLRGKGIAALHFSGVALADGNRGRDWRGIKTITITTTSSPANWDGRCGDATRGNEGHDKRDEGLVEHHREEWTEATVILKAEAALWTGK